MSAPPPQRAVEDNDCENDSDFIPSAGESGSSESESEAHNAKKQKLCAVETEDDLALKQEARFKQWEDFQASVSTPPPKKQLVTAKTVKIIKKYRFAGEDIIKVVEVSEDSEDAKKWPLLDPSADNQEKLHADSTASPSPVPSSSGTPQPKMKPRITPRKPRRSLDAMFATAKAKKLSTLDMSLMDWKEHVESSKDVKEDLEANRRGGGYLDRVEFLHRVEQRKEAERDLIGSKRRRA